MSDLAIELTGYVAGDDLEVRRTVTDLSAAIETAWLTVKRFSAQLDSDAVLQKVITTVDAPGTGQIVDAGDVEVDGDLRFDLAVADTTALGSRSWVYDIQIKLSDGKLYTIEKGTLQLTAGVTKATS